MVKAAVEIVGIEQVNAILNDLPKNWQKSVLSKAIKDITPILQEAAIRNVPSETVKKQIEVVRMKKTKLPGWWVGWSTEKRQQMYSEAKTRAEKAWAWMGGFWLEYGASGKSRRYMGRKQGVTFRVIQPVGWFRRAVDNTIDKLESEFMTYLHKSLNKFLDRRLKKYGL